MTRSPARAVVAAATLAGLALAACGAFSADEPAALVPDGGGADGSTSADATADGASPDAPGPDTGSACSTSTCASDAGSCFIPPNLPSPWTPLAVSPATVGTSGTEIRASARAGSQALYRVNLDAVGSSKGFVFETDLTVVSGDTFDLARFVVSGSVGSIFLRVTPAGVVTCQVQGGTTPCSDPPVLRHGKGPERIRWTGVGSGGNLELTVAVGCDGDRRTLVVQPPNTQVDGFVVGIDSPTTTTELSLVNSHLALY